MKAPAIQDLTELDAVIELAELARDIASRRRDVGRARHVILKRVRLLRIEEREAIEYAIGKLTTPKKDDPNALAQMILDAAKQASDLYDKGLI